LIFMAFNLKKPRPQGQPLGPIKDALFSSY